VFPPALLAPRSEASHAHGGMNRPMYTGPIPAGGPGSPSRQPLMASMPAPGPRGPVMVSGNYGDRPLLPSQSFKTGQTGPCGTGACNSANCGVASCGTTDYDEALIPSYVGGGRGCYRQETQYKYVGAGAGEFDLLAVPSNVRPNYCFCISLCATLALLLPLLLWLLLTHVPTGGGGVDASAQVQQQAVRFDCTAGFRKWRTSWPDKKKAYCCETEKRGCENDMDCSEGRMHWESWPDEKKAACCNKPGVCAKPAPSPATTSQPHDCNIGFEDWVHRWSIPKRVYCCLNARRGCPTAPPLPKPPPPTTPAPPFDCNAGFPNWHVGWSQAKKAWCCTHVGKGCEVPTVTSLPYDCNSDYVDCYHCLMTRWSVGKRAWCCAHARRGCATPAPPAVPATTSLPFDCNAGFNNWQAGWSPSKMAWCCQQQHKGCKPPTPATTECPPQDCNAGFANWRAGWTPQKKTWCCQHQGKGCM